jgi:hypothetical protein
MHIKNCKKAGSDKVVECTGKGRGKKAKAPPRGVKAAQLTGDDDQAVWGNQERRPSYYDHDACNNDDDDEDKDDGREERNQGWHEIESFRKENLWLLRREAEDRRVANLPRLPDAVYEAQGVGHKRYDAATLINRAVKVALTNPERKVCQNRLRRELDGLLLID